MKRLRPYHVRWILVALVVPVVILYGIGVALDSEPVLITATVLILCALLLQFIFYRCPFCHRYLHRSFGTYCPFCGRDMSDPQ